MFTAASMIDTHKYRSILQYVHLIYLKQGCSDDPFEFKDVVTVLLETNWQHSDLLAQTHCFAAAKELINQNASPPILFFVLLIDYWLQNILWPSESLTLTVLPFLSNISAAALEPFHCCRPCLHPLCYCRVLCRFASLGFFYRHHRCPC